MAFSLHGVHAPHRKNTEGSEPKRILPAKTVTIPMSMHIGRPAAPVLNVGDTVKVGTKIAEAQGPVSSPIYSSVSGKITAISDFLTAMGTTTQAIVITSDGEMTPDETIAPPTVDSKDTFVAAVRDAGIVGLGGAGFPTHVKFNVDSDKIEYLIINCAECEPYITSDTHTMLHRADDMELALTTIAKFYSIKKVIVGIEANKVSAIESMKALAEKLNGVIDTEVNVLPSLYPQGGEKVLIYHTAGRVVPFGKLPIDVGCAVINCTTLAAIGAYLKTGMPLVEKCLTVDGGAVKEPCNLIAPIGTPMKDIFDACGGFIEEPAKVLYGGPMMGISVPDTDKPVMKNTNAVLALTAKEAKMPKTTACIRCGSCTNSCPFGIAPAEIMKALDNRDAESLDKLSVMSCMECGCCSFVCPANRPLTQTNKIAKQFLKEEKSKEAAK